MSEEVISTLFRDYSTGKICGKCHREIELGGHSYAHFKGWCIDGTLNNLFWDIGGYGIFPGEHYMSENMTTSESVNLNICLAADDIINIFDEQGFTSDGPVDIELLRHLIVESIQKRLEK